MAKNKISEYSATAANNTDVGGIDIAEGCAPSGINNAIRELMAQLKDQQDGTDGDNLTVGGNLSVTGTTTATGLITANAGVTGALNGSLGATTPSTIVATTLTTTGNTILGDATTDTLNVGNGDLIKDASGNVGIGITPSAWGSSSAIQMTGGQSYSRYGIANNVYYDGASYRYISTATATLYGNNSGSHLWFTAPSGTAGNAVTFTQAMTLDASGNLGIGTTSPTATLDVNGTIKGDLSPSFTSTNQSLTATGYQKLPGGLIMQWGTVPALGDNASTTLTFATAFPTAAFSFVAMSEATSAGADVAYHFRSLTTTNVLITQMFSASNVGGRYIALGY